MRLSGRGIVGLGGGVVIRAGWPVRLAPEAAAILRRDAVQGQVFSVLGPTITVVWQADTVMGEQIDERNVVCAGCGLPVRPFGQVAPFCAGAAAGKARLCAASGADLPQPHLSAEGGAP